MFCREFLCFAVRVVGHRTLVTLPRAEILSNCANLSTSSICLFMNEGWPLSGTFSISLCLLSSFEIFMKELQRFVSGMAPGEG